MQALLNVRLKSEEPQILQLKIVVKIQNVKYFTLYF